MKIARIKRPNSGLQDNIENLGLLTKRLERQDVFLGEGRCTESRVGTDPLIKFPLQDTPVESV